MRSRLTVAICFSLGFWCLAVNILYSSVSLTLEWRRTRTWTVVKARLLCTPVGHGALAGSKTSIRNEVPYTYVVNGKLYVGDRVTIAYGYPASGSEFAESLQEHYERSLSIDCYVDQSRPWQSVLDRKLPADLLAAHHFLAIVFGSMGFLVIWEHTKRAGPNVYGLRMFDTAISRRLSLLTAIWCNVAGIPNWYVGTWSLCSCHDDGLIVLVTPSASLWVLVMLWMRPRSGQSRNVDAPALLS